MAMPEKVKAETIIPFIKIPREITKKADLNDIPIKKAATAPVQPPVKGNRNQITKKRDQKCFPKGKI